ncbi:hypothetical protein [Celeribacter baekdonensis]|uniref:hypothetical protein n=1 Tax=Celeribacter baekdonensis TaxID=875171 RepID=UPI0030DD00CF|tara:strand:- start:303013 stop:303606 length:594 start_codon:yes stop_codon:yes gene_type:complete
MVDVTFDVKGFGKGPALVGVLTLAGLPFLFFVAAAFYVGPLKIAFWVMLALFVWALPFSEMHFVQLLGKRQTVTFGSKSVTIKTPFRTQVYPLSDQDPLCLVSEIDPEESEPAVMVIAKSPGRRRDALALRVDALMDKDGKPADPFAILQASHGIDARDQDISSRANEVSRDRFKGLKSVAWGIGGLAVIMLINLGY